MTQLLFKTFGISLLGIACALQATASGRPIQKPNSTNNARQVGGPKVVVTRLNAFGVPFKINAADSAFIEVQLYLSQDQGRTWSFFARQTTDNTEFPFQASSDGEYWFALKTLSRDRQLLPTGDPQPELKILVDTKQPKLDFRIRTDPAGRVICRWHAVDENLDPATLKILYQPVMIDGSVKPWQTVPVQLKGVARNGVYADQVGWWPDTTQAMVSVAIEIQDKAGNKVRSDRRVKLPSTAWRSRSQNTALPAKPVADARTRPIGNQQKNLKPIVNGNSGGGTGLPKQPDWAYPGWQPPAKQTPPASPIRALPTNQVDHVTSAQPQVGKVPNVVCKDGVCVRTPVQDIAQRGKISQQRLAANTPRPMKLIGSPEEFAAPPVPAGYVFPAAEQNLKQPLARVARAPKQARIGQQSSIPWQSEKENWKPFGSTGNPKFDATITPQSTRQSPAPGPATDVPSNPGKMFYEGNKVIGQSSTKGASNQFRGNQTISQLPKPALLPNYPAPAIERRELNRPVDARTKNSASRKPFSNAGFASQAKPSPRSVVGMSQQPNRATRAPVQIIGSKRFRLNYGIDAIDPSGVDKVVLWITRNDGQTWKTWGTDPDRRSPFPVETVEDGRYGFRIVVKSRDGLTGQGPSSGDDADIWITVDTEAPLVQITSAPYGRGPEAGRLVINFKASDSFLTLRPIKLSYAANPDGPWEVIEDGVRNQERYLWKVGREVPEQIFLKIEAVDRAGNVGVHRLSQPVDVSGLVPRGTIHGVTPVGN